MEYSVEKISSNQVKIAFKATAEEFNEAIVKAYNKNKGQVAVPGFRKGKAPLKVIERYYGAGVFYEDALDELFPAAYQSAIAENDLHPVDRPEMSSIDQMEAGKELLFSCTVYVMPDVKLGEYKGVEVEKEVTAVTAEDVDARIETERQKVARAVEVTDRALEDGDTANLDYCGTVDGVAFEGGTAEGQTLVIGSGSFIPGFEAQMIGMNVGEERDLSVKFPEEYHAENLKGKDAVFHVKLNGITKEELPALDDDFAAEVSDFDTLAEYRANLEKTMQDSANAENDDRAKNDLLEKIAEASEVDIPKAMVEDKLDDMMQEMSWNMQRQGYTMDMFLKMVGQTKEQMREMYREQATKNLKVELTIDAIIKAENIEATDEEVDKLVSDYAASINQTADQLKKAFGESQLSYFKHQACVNKAVELVWNAAKVSEKTEDKAEENA